MRSKLPRFPAVPFLIAVVKVKSGTLYLAYATVWAMHMLRITCYLGVAFGVFPVSADDWPQWQGPNRDGVWHETGIIEKFSSNGPPVRWRAKIGAGYSGPIVARGRVYVTDRRLTQASGNPSDPFQRGEVPGGERVLCLDEADGHALWTHEYACVYTISYPAGPRVAPLVSDGKIYTLGAEGNLFCLGSETGNVIWSKDFKKSSESKLQCGDFLAIR